MEADFFRSNCFVEVLKAWVRSGGRARIINLKHRAIHRKGVHYGWQIAGQIWHFRSIKAAYRPWWRNIFFIGNVAELKHDHETTDTYPDIN